MKTCREESEIFSNGEASLDKTMNGHGYWTMELEGMVGKWVWIEWKSTREEEETIDEKRRSWLPNE